MGRIAFLFPGQGAQKVGMAQDFYEKCPLVRETFEAATRQLGFSMEELCFTPNDRLDLTEYTQAALLTACVSILREVESRGIRADVAAGLSLGEYSALVACGVMGFEDAVSVVRRRGILMQEAVPAGQGGMAAVMGLANETIEDVLRDRKDVQIANYNCPGQTVISGKLAAVEEAGAALKAAGAKRVVPLNVSGPFHSAMLQEAGEKLGETLEPVVLAEPRIPYITNVTAEYVTQSKEVKDLLKCQVSHGVRWQQTMERMLADGIDTFVEIGPGRTLTGFLRKMTKEAKWYNVETLEQLEALEI
ncbi:ACP S-malonyltransferase [Hominifimenecus sp. rT4P-3]|uniref:ACP S-malonyltransferase n=1 Tax=Hominifimenecus sp. rT4P-3 TaxID=3242979 RepID=UPI003DA5C16D